MSSAIGRIPRVDSAKRSASGALPNADTWQSLSGQARWWVIGVGRSPGRAITLGGGVCQDIVTVANS